MYAWENPGVPVDEVVNDVLRAFHHPAARNEHIQIQRDMFETVRKWTQETPYRNRLDHLLSSESVRNHKNHILSGESGSGSRSVPGGGCGHGDGGHGRPAGSLWSQIQTLNREAQDSGSGSAPSQTYGGGQASSYYPGTSPQPQQTYGGRPGSSGYAGGGSYGQPTPPPQHSYGGQQGYPGQGGYGQHQHQHQHQGGYHGQEQGYHQQPHYGGGGGGHQGGYGGPPPPGPGQYGQQPPSWGGYPRY